MTSDDSTGPNPYTRPGFLAAAALVIILAVVGVVLGIASLTRDDSNESTPPTPATTTPESQPSALPSDLASTSASSSICGLEGEILSGTVTIAPTSGWDFQGTTAYPISTEHGPAEDTSDGVRSCFQRSPEGALFMAANAVVQGSDSETGLAWADYFLADGPYRDALLADVTYSDDAPESRMSIVAFRMLDYNGDSARVDIAARVSTQTATSTVSGVYELVWADGDWKIDTTTEEPIRYAPIPDTAGYIPWMG
jgi:hypothetical protein